MILLIPNAEEIKKELLNDLNSIMILLILVSIWQKYHICTFKFHYDSINSESCRHCHRWLVNLNSIMILLILYSFLLSRLFLNDLNSIMILLILLKNPDILLLDEPFKFHYDSINSQDADAIYREEIAKFKFHYDSINSRPKIIPLFKPKNVSILSTSSKFNISFLSLIIYFCNTSYFRRFRLLSIPYIFCTIRGRQKPLIFQVDFVRHILLWNLFAKYAS